MTKEQLNQFKADNTRQVPLPDGTTRWVRATPDIWADVEFLEVVEEISQRELAAFALEETELQDVTFDRAFRGVVAHLANRWT